MLQYISVMKKASFGSVQPQVNYSFLSSASVLKVAVGANRTVKKIKELIEQQHKLSPGSVNIVSDIYGSILEDGEILDITKVFKVMQHPNSRKVPALLKTTLPDITYQHETEPRVLLSCGHAMAADTLYQNITVQIKRGETVLTCFSCKKEWDFQDTSERAQMSVDEKLFWGIKISLNSVGDECPQCGYYCQRIAGDNDRAVCMKCTKGSLLFEFCWQCKCQWAPNHNCNSKADIQRMLRDCRKKEIEYSHIPNVPTIRLCPNCGALIEHLDMCKEIRCYRCKESFCFVCLKMCQYGRLSCTSYNSKCPVAPMQIV